MPSGNGTITQLRVKVGSSTGQMQFVVLRALREASAGPGAGAACCSELYASEPFTPTANAVTSVNVNWPVRNDLTPDPVTDLYTFDQIAISVLEPGVAIPANDTGIYSSNGPIDNVYWPAWSHVGQERADGGGPEGFEVLINGDWQATASPPTPTPTPAPLPLPLRPVLPQLQFPQGTARVHGNSALVDLLCAAGAACGGQMQLQSAAGATATSARVASHSTRSQHSGKKKASKPVTYGTASFSLAAGTSQMVSVHLSSAGRMLVRKRKKAKVWLNITLGSRKSSHQIVLRR
ncbi:MAG: hypothetical protein ACHQAV_00965 [Solirubrobacterales bacterium]